ncbi:hypothetical protein [Pseudodesulfovibrio sediminis]|uniref:Uncharacterized protein n=1 Tax=Pseudodesulfovibrio sediminis TaxID=2810563 RepID=A0ABN6EUC8_9BACT|nr:hypothetical protein [Pseudodesulfovibrio sediminis]BCS88659.1 hypothetical protein PSDVSF_19010 [Pseudodesulfovibrio sediminis]
MTQENASKSDKRLSDDIPTLEAEVVTLTKELEDTVVAIRTFMEAEDPRNGIYHHEEIFRLQQDKLRLDVEIKFRTNKINRINLGIDETGPSEGVKNGFLF